MDDIRNDSYHRLPPSIISSSIGTCNIYYFPALELSESAYAFLESGNDNDSSTQSYIIFSISNICQLFVNICYVIKGIGLLSMKGWSLLFHSEACQAQQASFNGSRLISNITVTGYRDNCWYDIYFYAQTYNAN